MHKANDILRTIRIKTRSDVAIEKHPHFQIDLSKRKRKATAIIRNTTTTKRKF